jgi:agmatine deiminase
MNQLPPEWYPQSGVMLTWPHAQMDWWTQQSDTEKTFLEIAKQIALREKVLINCFSEEQRAHILEKLSQMNTPLSQVRIYINPADDVWARDHGPLTVLSEKNPLILDFVFNGWGNKYPASRDNELTLNLHRQHVFSDTPINRFDLVLEGGSIEVDGKGTLLTTESCLLAKNRNPNLSREVIERNLIALLGVNRILWLKHGYLAGDDTDGHIDTLARFTDEHTICYVTCDDEADEHYAELQKMESELKSFKDFQENPYRLIPLPWPHAKVDVNGNRLPATYANFLIINQAVLMPTYNDAADSLAIQQLQKCFPDREIVGIPCLPLIENFGSLHCVTMQLPKNLL